MDKSGFYMHGNSINALQGGIPIDRIKGIRKVEEGE